MKSGTASEREIAKSLGSKAPISKDLAAEATATQRNAKDLKVSKCLGQNQLDAEVLLGTTKRALFQEKLSGNVIPCACHVLTMLTLLLLYSLFSYFVDAVMETGDDHDDPGADDSDASCHEAEEIVDNSFQEFFQRYGNASYL